MTQGFSKKYSFKEAVPVWEKQAELEKNHSVILRAVLPKGTDAVLRLAAHCRYQIFINSAFFAAGPARAAHGFYRVSEYDLKTALNQPLNTVCIIAAGYNINSFEYLDAPSFVCAEILSGDKVLFATGGKNGFDAVRYTERVKRTPKFSFQRAFTEYYRLSENRESFFNGERGCTAAELEPTQPKSFIERNVPYCEYRKITAAGIVSTGSVCPAEVFEEQDCRYVSDIGEKLKGYTVQETEASCVNEVLALDFSASDVCKTAAHTLELNENSFAVYDMGLDTTGYIKITIETLADTELFVVFGEVLGENGLPQADANGAANTVKWELKGGRRYELVSFEAYTYKFIQLISLRGGLKIVSVDQYRETFNEALLTNKKKMPTPELQTVYDAAVESFVQNCTDIYMDCPSRERAGWLCDSFFTARTERELTGRSRVEHNFLENFLMAESFAFLPDGMLPMCYPSDHYDGVYIPNWAMWYVLELKEYRDRTGDEKLTELARERVFALCDFFEKYENADGLLQNLDSWVFIEWSKANDYVQDINYPTNMLYALFLDCAGRLYDDESLRTKAEKLRETIRRQALDGEFFCDNAIINGKAALCTENRSETCQYYAFFTGTATKEEYPDLFGKLVKEFGPSRDAAKTYPNIDPSNAFIGNYLRLEILFNEGLYEQLAREIEAFFLPMAQKTGTLWEHMHSGASCNHGFTSHCIRWLNNIF